MVAFSAQYTESWGRASIHTIDQLPSSSHVAIAVMPSI